MVAARGSVSPPAMTRSERCFRVSSGLDLEFLIWRGPVKYMQSCLLARLLQPPGKKEKRGVFWSGTNRFCLKTGSGHDAFFLLLIVLFFTFFLSYYFFFIAWLVRYLYFCICFGQEFARKRGGSNDNLVV
ncbi:hypothetical protein V2G26_016792 [Clonostachys chloroleuca]